MNDYELAIFDRRLFACLIVAGLAWIALMPLWAKSPISYAIMLHAVIFNAMMAWFAHRKVCRLHKKEERQ